MGCDGRPVWSRTSDCQSGNPGSNPGRRIVYSESISLTPTTPTCTETKFIEMRITNFAFFEELNVPYMFSI